MYGFLHNRSIFEQIEKQLEEDIFFASRWDFEVIVVEIWAFFF